MNSGVLLQGRSVLVVEDEYLLAIDVVQRLHQEGAKVLGPVGAVDDALDLLDATEALDGAVLDINLSGEMVFPVADALQERGVPFVFTTGYDQASIPARYAHVTRCEKPFDAASIGKALFG